MDHLWQPLSTAHRQPLCLVIQSHSACIFFSLVLSVTAPRSFCAGSEPMAPAGAISAPSPTKNQALFSELARSKTGEIVFARCPSIVLLTIPLSLSFCPLSFVFYFQVKPQTMLEVNPFTGVPTVVDGTSDIAQVGISIDPLATIAQVRKKEDWDYASIVL